MTFLVEPALALARVAELDAKLGRLVVVEACELGHDMLLGVILDALGETHLLSLDDDFHGRQSAQTARPLHPAALTVPGGHATEPRLFASPRKHSRQIR